MNRTALLISYNLHNPDRWEDSESRTSNMVLYSTIGGLLGTHHGLWFLNQPRGLGRSGGFPKTILHVCCSRRMHVKQQVRALDVQGREATFPNSGLHRDCMEFI